MRFDSPNPESTRNAGRALAQSYDASQLLVVTLLGPLGAGKTVFVKGLAEGLGIEPGQVASPTFVIANQHFGKARLAHVDLYRLERAEELDAAGFPDWLEAGWLVAIEWGDRFPAALPEDRLEVRIDRDGEQRHFEVRGLGPLSRATAERWEQALGARATT